MMAEKIKLVTGKKYFKSNKSVQMEILWYKLREIRLLILLGIVFAAYLKWG